MIPNGMIGMNQLPDVPSVKDLWKNEKSKYRIWIIIFLVGMLTVFSLLLVGIILNSLNQGTVGNATTKGTGIKGQIYSYFYDEIFNTSTNRVDASKNATNSFFVRDIFVFPGIQLGVIFIGLVYFGYTLVLCYKNKTFSKLSSWATFIMGLSAILSVYNLLQMIWGYKVILEFDTGIYVFVNYFVTILFYIFGAAKVSKIRRLFIISERVESIKSDPRYQEMISQLHRMQAQSSSEIINTSQTQNQYGMPVSSNSSINENAFEKDKELRNEMFSKLSKMTTKELKEIASKFSISGIEEMSNNEIIDKIIDAEIANNKLSENKNLNKLNKMTIAELRKIASKLSISGSETMKKNELIKIILNIYEKE